MATGRANYNGTANAGANKVIAPTNASRTGFFFKSLGEVFVLNFGEVATADNVLHINADESIFLTNDPKTPYDIRASLNVFCASASDYECQVEEMTV